MQSGMEKTMWCHLDLEGPSSARGQTLFKGRKLPWKCGAVSVRLSSDSSQVAVTCELHLCSCLIDVHYPPPRKKDKWNVESNTKMQKNQFITTASLTGSQVKEWFLAGLEPKTSDVTADGQDQSMKYAIRLDLACLRASRIKDSGGSIYPSSTAQAVSKGH